MVRRSSLGFGDDLGAHVDEVTIELPDPLEYFAAWWGPQAALADADLEASGVHIEAPPAVRAVLEPATDMTAVDYARVQFEQRERSTTRSRRSSSTMSSWSGRRPRWSPSHTPGKPAGRPPWPARRCGSRAPEPALHRGDQPCRLSGHHRAGRLDSGRTPSGPAGRSAPRRRCRCAHRRGGVRTSPTLVEPATRTVGAHVTSELISSPPDVEIIGPSPLDSRADHHQRSSCATGRPRDRRLPPRPGSLPAPAILVRIPYDKSGRYTFMPSSPPTSRAGVRRGDPGRPGQVSLGGRAGAVHP